MGAKDLPVSNTQSSHDRFSFLAAKLGICIHRGHQDRRVLVILRLLGGQPMGVDVNITGKGNVIIVVDQHNFTGKVATLSFINLKMKITEIKKADLCQRLP